IGLKQAADLPNATTFCGKCEEVCPVRIPLPKMMRYWRDREFEARLTPTLSRLGLAAWTFLATRPALYRAATGLVIGILGALGRNRGRFRRLPLAGGWTAARDLPAPQGRTFMRLWAQRRRGRP
ncbi:MAG: lactate utilization protein LutB domain-containing protein, partial [Alphaproteobacteria bacterium]